MSLRSACIWRSPAGRARCGSTSRSTCRATLVDEDDLEPYRGDDDGRFDEALARAQARELVARLEAAERPVLLAGSGVRIGHAIAAVPARGRPPRRAAAHGLERRRRALGGPSAVRRAARAASATGPATSPCRTPTWS